MRNLTRRLLILSALAVGLALPAGCGEAGADIPPANTEVKLKPLPKPGSPADAPGTGNTRPGGNANTE